MKKGRGRFFSFKYIFLFLFSGLCLLAFFLSFSVYSIYGELVERLEKKSFQPTLRYFSAPQTFFSGSGQSMEKVQRFLESHHYRRRREEQPLYQGDFARLSPEACRKALKESFPLREKHSGFSCLGVSHRLTSLAFWEKAPWVIFLFTEETAHLKQIFVGTLGDPQKTLRALPVFASVSASASASTSASAFASASASAFVWKKVDRVEMEPQLLAQYTGGSLTFQEYRPLGHIPTDCLNAVISIEDNRFLYHRGVHWRSLFRATFKNLKALGWRQGGSTITQQMVKNYFLHPKKTLGRKFKEMIIALLLEYRMGMDKDTIMENYLNIIYLGQESTLSVRGFPAAARYYFDRDISQLNLVECAQLAGMIYSPRRINPFKYPERAQKRRHQVLQKMEGFGHIGQQERVLAQSASLRLPLNSNSNKDSASGERGQGKQRSPSPRSPRNQRKQKWRARFSSLQTAPYYIEMVNPYLAKKGWSWEKKIRKGGHHEGNIFTFLNPRLQKMAQESLQNHLRFLEKHRASIAQIKEEEGLSLEAFMLVAEVETGNLVSVVGGRHYGKSPFNRALKSQRSIGSTIKPFIYLHAMEQIKKQGGTPDPLQEVIDRPFLHTYQRQQKKWSPKNYGNKYYGAVPAFYALALSLNSATAWLALESDLSRGGRGGSGSGNESGGGGRGGGGSGNESESGGGVGGLVKLLRRLGVQSSFMESPALTLGALSMKSVELLQMYLTLARMGSFLPVRPLLSVESAGGWRTSGSLKSPENAESLNHLKEKKLWFRAPSREERAKPVVEPALAALLVSMLKQVFTIGTARFFALDAQFLNLAGKTGTTNDFRDGWFVGFSPLYVSLVWVGYDDHRPHGLSGGGAALPIWLNFMKKAHFGDPRGRLDFLWPDEVEKKKVSMTSLLLPPEAPGQEVKEVELFFLKGRGRDN